MKNKRQMLILDIIHQLAVETQDELVEALRQHGMDVTQATVSRDIKELRLIKSMDETGKYRYAMPVTQDKTLNERLIRLFVDSVVSIRYANNLIVIKTLSGSAGIAGETLDALQLSEIIGTIAGDNTLLVITESNEAAVHVTEILNRLLA